MEMSFEPEPSEGVGLGMLLVIAVLGGAAAVLAVLLVTRHHAAQTSTVFITRPAATAPIQTHATATTAPAMTAAAATTAPVTTEQQTTTQARATVPNVSGDLQSALQAVRNAGFSATVHYVPSAEPRGTVVAQSPTGGSTAPTSAQVTINVSSGQHTEGVNVPSTLGMTIPQAVSAVQSAGLHLVMLRRAVTDQSEAGKVVAQTPAAGQEAPKNSRVVVYMGAFSG